MTKEITLNRAQCLVCGDIITSLHVHDYVSCSCGAIAVDGGKEYLKRSFAREQDFKEMSEFEPGHLSN